MECIWHGRIKTATTNTNYWPKGRQMIMMSGCFAILHFRVCIALDSQTAAKANKAKCKSFNFECVSTAIKIFWKTNYNSKTEASATQSRTRKTKFIRKRSKIMCLQWQCTQGDTRVCDGNCTAPGTYSLYIYRLGCITCEAQTNKQTNKRFVYANSCSPTDRRCTNCVHSPNSWKHR